MPTVRLPNNWRPRPDQMKLWMYLEDGGKRAVEVAHRRFGKDDVALHFTATALHERIGNYWHMLPKYEQARKAIWDAINPKTGKRRIDEAFPLELRKATNQNEMKIDFLCGSMWQLVGSDNYNSYVGSPPIGIVLSEWALANPLAWRLGLMPILEQNGGWALFIYTPRGDNHGKSLYEFAAKEPGWFAEISPADKTPVFSKEQLDRILRQMIAEIGDPDEAEAIFKQEYFCSFTGSVRGSYYSRQISAAENEGRICLVPWQPAIEVDTFWDLGVDDSMTIWFIQAIGKGFHVIDYYENSGFGLEHYAKILQAKHYKYGNHYFPHDADAREMTNSEIAKSRREVAEGLGINPIKVVSRVKNMDVLMNVHIPAVRNVLPLCWFDAEKCAAGISALKNYHAEWNEEKEKAANHPDHDWSSHAADAFRTFAVGYREPVKVKSVTEYMDARASAIAY